MTQARLWYWQRMSAMLLGVCVLVHLVVMVYAVRGGLSAAEILERTRGSWAYGAFYGLFVLACAVHVPIGVANIVREWWGWRAATSAILASLLGIGLTVLGMRAVYGVIVP